MEGPLIPFTYVYEKGKMLYMICYAYRNTHTCMDTNIHISADLYHVLLYVADLTTWLVLTAVAVCFKVAWCVLRLAVV